MVTRKLFKRRVRERMSKTGESYSAARGHLAARRDRLRAATGSLDGALELASDAKVLEATGRDWQAWLSMLDRWGARKRKRGDVVDFLMADHGVPGWYAQAIATGFERTRGLRLKHQQPDGFTVYGTRTVGVPVDVAFDAFVDPELRRRWLGDGTMSNRTSRRARTAHFDWDGGPSRVSVTFDPKDSARTTVAVAHERLPDPDAAEAAKAAWKQRLAALKFFLESTAASD